MGSATRTWKLTAVIVATLLGATAMAFLRYGSPFPRPWFVFVGAACVLAVLAVPAGVLPRESIPVFGFLALLTGFFLRGSGFVRLVSSGVDHGRWLSYADGAVAAGHVTGTDMYAASPLYILDLVVGMGVFGGPIQGTRFYTLLAAAFLPAFIGLLAYRLFDDRRVAYAAVVLGAAGPLFFRTAALLESESLAISWFVLGVYLFVRSLYTDETLFYGLFLLVAGTAVVLHFFYGVVLVVTLGLALLAVYALQRFETTSIPRPRAGLTLGVLAVGVLTLSWIVWSVYAHTAIVTLESTTSLTLQLDVSVFLPAEGSAGESVGAGGDGQGPALFGLLSVGLIGVLGLAGAAYTLVAGRGRLGLIIGVVLTGISLGSLVASPDYDLGFRTYYFVLVAILVFAGVAVVVAVREVREYRGVVRAAAMTVLAVCLLSYALFAPVSPIGNNVDPRFGGTQWALTNTEYAQLQDIDSRYDGAQPITNELPQVHTFLLPQVASENLFLTTTDCHTNSTISDTGTYAVCLHSHRA